MVMSLGGPWLSAHRLPTREAATHTGSVNSRDVALKTSKGLEAAGSPTPCLQAPQQSQEGPSQESRLASPPIHSFIPLGSLSTPTRAPGLVLGTRTEQLTVPGWGAPGQGQSSLGGPLGRGGRSQDGSREEVRPELESMGVGIGGDTRVQEWERGRQGPVRAGRCRQSPLLGGAARFQGCGQIVACPHSDQPSRTY